MPQSQPWEHGLFCWVNLSTSDPTSARKFYADLLGWSYKDIPMPGDMPGTYTMIQLQGADLGGVSSQSEQDRARGIPPHWMPYVAVDDLDATTARVSSLGGQVLMEPVDIPTVGRMSVFQDPTGASLSLWQRTSPHPGTAHFEANTPGMPCWAELLSRDAAGARAFYSELIGWKPDQQQIGGIPYTILKAGDKPAGGLMAIAPDWGDMPSQWVAYFVVTDLDRALGKVTSGGGATIATPPPVEGIGRFAMISDPQGATLGIIEPA